MDMTLKAMSFSFGKLLVSPTGWGEPANPNFEGADNVGVAIPTT